MSVSEKILKAANSLLTAIVVLLLLIAGSYSLFALWDNAQVYAAVDNAMEGLMKLKPDPDGDAGASFAELLSINEDVCAWITLENTEIDYPVVQGEDNLTYLNKDVYGDFALSGSIFLDAGCSSDFTDSYLLLYGHHMANDKMFGDLDLYLDEDFFRENTTGTLVLPDRSERLEIFACLQVPASEDAIFDPSQWRTDNTGLLTYVSEHALYVNETTMAQIGTDGDGSQVLAMATCSSEYTDARTVLLARMVSGAPEE